MPKTLIAANPDFVKPRPETANFLEISEFFYDTIQGENNVGWPTAFLRLQHCSLDCTYCDTSSVWRYGNTYSFDELFELMEKIDESGKNLIQKFKDGQRCVLTGGSPLKQQFQLVQFIKQFEERYHFYPYFEIENECTIMPSNNLIPFIQCWNNSPKLSSSGNLKNQRYKPEIIHNLTLLVNSWFKFVICDRSEWDEIQKDFIDTGLIPKNKIVLMPLGENRVELERNRELTVEISIENNVRYTTREHIVLWDKKTGV